MAGIQPMEIAESFGLFGAPNHIFLLYGDGRSPSSEVTATPV